MVQKAMTIHFLNITMKTSVPLWLINTALVLSSLYLTAFLAYYLLDNSEPLPKPVLTIAIWSFFVVTLIWKRRVKLSEGRHVESDG